MYGVVFAHESIRDLWPEILPLLQRNHNETGALDSRRDFCPDQEVYNQLETLGILKVFTVRSAGVLVGYGAFGVVAHPHYPMVIMARQDALWIKPAHRGRTAYRFVEWTDGELLGMGVNEVYRDVTFKKDYSRMLVRMGYEAVEIGYVKELA